MRDAQHSTSDIITVFARQGIALSTLARAMAMPIERVEGMCSRAKESGELQMIPPHSPDDVRHVMLSEVTNLRAQLDDAQATIRELRGDMESEPLVGVAKMTRSEAKVLSAIIRTGRATKTSIYHALYQGMEDRDLREPKIVDVMICKVRKKLLPLGITIETIWGTGYSMRAENVARLRNIAAGETLATIESPRLQASIDEMVA